MPTWTAKTAFPSRSGSPQTAGAQILAGARHTLQDVLEWSLSPGAEIMSAMAEAFERGYLALLDAATVKLDLASMYRVIKLGNETDDDEESTPQRIREQANHLVHSLLEADRKRT